MKNIAIITARSGSKGLKNKNILDLNGKPLIAYTIEAAIKSKVFDEVMVSTDSVEYAEIAKRYGASVPFLRNFENSQDLSSSWDTVCEVLNNYVAIGNFFDTVCLLQPTSPLRDANNICEAYDLLNTLNANAITGVCEVEHSPLWCNILPSDHCMDSFISPQIIDKGRQALDKYYRINGAIYIRKIGYDNNQCEIIDEPSFAYTMEQNKSIDIDGEIDFKFAELLINESK